MEKSNKFKGALFDLDGTLADNCVAIRDGLEACFKKFGIDEPIPDVSTVRRTIGGSILLTIQKFLPEGKKHLAKSLGEYYMEIFPSIIFNGLIALPFAGEVLSDLHARGLKLACFSNKQEPAVGDIMGKLGLSKYLDACIGTSLESPRKPDAAYTNYALKKIGVSASEAIMIGDSPYDFQAAQNAGMRCALVATGSHSKADLIANCAGVEGVFDNLLDLESAVF